MRVSKCKRIDLGNERQSQAMWQKQKLSERQIQASSDDKKGLLLRKNGRPREWSSKRHDALLCSAKCVGVQVLHGKIRKQIPCASECLGWDSGLYPFLLHLKKGPKRYITSSNAGTRFWCKQILFTVFHFSWVRLQRGRHSRRHAERMFLCWGVNAPSRPSYQKLGKSEAQPVVSQ